MSLSIVKHLLPSRIQQICHDSCYNKYTKYNKEASYYEYYLIFEVYMGDLM